VNKKNKSKKKLNNNNFSVLKNNSKLLKFKNILRFTNKKNYANNFGYQWNKFSKTQLLDKKNEFKKINSQRFFNSTNWKKKELSGQKILEVGSGAGRFSEVVLNSTKAHLYSIDYSTAVDANYSNNYKKKFKKRFFLYQSSVYNMPFKNNIFDKAFCFGVLQHTPNVERVIFSIAKKLKIGGEIVVDFYPLKGFYTFFQAKYLLRLITKKMSNDKLFQIINNYVDIMMKIYFFLRKIKLGFFTRILPIVDIHNTLPNLEIKNLRENVVLELSDNRTAA
jgi:ubiquinone/menaquinone biosynthesis C-methylase UbiE